MGDPWKQGCTNKLAITIAAASICLRCLVALKLRTTTTIFSLKIRFGILGNVNKLELSKLKIALRHMQLAHTQINLCICTVWCGSLLFSKRMFEVHLIHLIILATSVDSDQTGFTNAQTDLRLCWLNYVISVSIWRGSNISWYLSQVTISMLGTLNKIFRWYFDFIFFLFFLGNRIWHFMQTVSIGDNLHEMSNPVFWLIKNKKKNDLFVICWTCPESDKG